MTKIQHKIFIYNIKYYIKYLYIKNQIKYYIDSNPYIYSEKGLSELAFLLGL